MLFNIVLILSQYTVEAEVSTEFNPSYIESTQSDIEEPTSYTNELPLEEPINGALCSELNGRRLFWIANIGAPLGTAVAIGGLAFILDGIDSNISPVMVGSFFTGLGMMVGSGIALPISVHKLHEDALEKGYTPVFNEETLIIFDFGIFMGNIFGLLVPPLFMMSASGYLLHELTALDIILEIRKAQKSVCGETF